MIKCITCLENLRMWTLRVRYVLRVLPLPEQLLHSTREGQYRWTHDQVLKVIVKKPPAQVIMGILP